MGVSASHPSRATTDLDLALLRLLLKNCSRVDDLLCYLVRMKTFFAIASLAAISLTAAACGDSDGSSSSEVAVSASSSTEPGENAAATLEIVQTAIEEQGYTCGENLVILSPALSVVCLGSGPIAVGYAWESADIADQYGYNDYSCTPDSPIGEQRYLKENNWMIKVASLTSSTSENSTEIDAVLASLQASLGGELNVQPCLPMDEWGN